MVAAFLERARVLSVHEVEKPKCGNDEVLVRIHSTGICGSDLHYYKEGRVGTNVITDPLILGHESSGEVVAVGSEVSHVVLGDRVTIEPGVPCLKCEYCLTGRYNLCNSVKFIGAPPYHGTFREFVSHKGLFVHKLPDSVTYEDGACVEPLAVGFHSVSRAGIRPGEKVLVTGAGPIGLIVMMFARLAGGEVTVSDVDDYRIGIAGDMGADEIINTGNDDLPMNTYNCIIEATGNTKIYPSIIKALKKGGRLVVVGMSNTAPTVDLTALMRKEADIITVYRYANCFHPVLRLLEKGRIDVKALVSHRFPLSGIADAFSFVEDPSQNKVKVIVNCGGS